MHWASEMNTPERAKSTPCCICHETKPSSRPISRGHRATLQSVPHGTVIRTSDSNSLYLPPLETLRNEDIFLCFCKPCRLKSLEFSGNRTPSQNRAERKRSQGSSLAEYHARKKLHREKDETLSTKAVLRAALNDISKCLEDKEGSLLWMKDRYEIYKQNACKENVHAVSMRTFRRRVGALPSVVLTKSHTVRGHVISLCETSARLVLDAVQRQKSLQHNGKGHMVDSDRRLALQNLCTLYKGSREEIYPECDDEKFDCRLAQSH